MERFNSEVDGGMDAYDAELLITELTKELGKGLIGDWAEKSQESVIKRDTKFSNIVKNGKKNATGIPSSRKLRYTPVGVLFFCKGVLSI